MLYNEEGNRVDEPVDARRMFARPANLMVSLIEDEDNSTVKMFIGKGTNINEVLGLVSTLRTVATKFNFLFNIRKYGKEIEPKDFSSSHSINEAEQMADFIINETFKMLKS